MPGDQKEQDESDFQLMVNINFKVLTFAQVAHSFWARISEI